MNLKRDRALFLDRDGVINIDKEYLYKKEDFEFIDGIFELIKIYQDSGYKIIVVTNQSGIGRGYYTQDDYMRLTEYMIDEFKKRDIRIDGVYHCPHTPEDRCSCRKPRSGMFMAAKRDFKLDMKNSVMIGDKDSDMKAAKNAKVGERIFLSSDQSRSLDASKRVKDLFELIYDLKENSHEHR